MWRHRLRSSAIGRRTSRLAGAVMFLAGAAFAAPAFAAEDAVPQRIVSINLCTDQILLSLGLGARLVAVSDLADDQDISSMWQAAQIVPTTPAALESVVSLSPDMVFAGAFGHARLTAQLEKLGIRVVRIADAARLADIAQTYTEVAAYAGAAETAKNIAARLEALLAKPSAPRTMSALLVSPGMLVHGPQMLGGAVLAHAGYVNMQGAYGDTTYVTLEQLVTAPPARLFIAEQVDAAPSRSGRLFAHPALSGAVDVERVPPSALLCGSIETARLAAQLAQEVSAQ